MIVLGESKIEEQLEGDHARSKLIEKQIDADAEVAPRDRRGCARGRPSLERPRETHRVGAKVIVCSRIAVRIWS